MARIRVDDIRCRGVRGRWVAQFRAGPTTPAVAPEDHEAEGARVIGLLRCVLAGVVLGSGIGPGERVAIQDITVAQHAELDGLDLEVEQTAVTRHVRVGHDRNGKPDVTRLRVQGREIVVWLHLLRCGEAGTAEPEEHEGSARESRMGPPGQEVRRGS